MYVFVCFIVFMSIEKNLNIYILSCINVPVNANTDLILSKSLFDFIEFY